MTIKLKKNHSKKIYDLLLCIDPSRPHAFGIRKDKDRFIPNWVRWVPDLVPISSELLQNSDLSETVKIQIKSTKDTNTFYVSFLLQKNKNVKFH
jgi:hypothetical protein